MPKSHDEIKKGLECCIESTCEPCRPYGNASNCNFAIHLLEDVLGYIQQLEAERDAAVEDIKEAHDAYCGCVTCKNYRVNADCQEPLGTFCPNCPNDNCPCKGCSSKLEKWEWRGVQKED